MRIIFIIFLILLNNCSFDNKSGIWKSESGSFQKDDRTFKDFKKIQSSNKPYNEIKNLDSNFNFLVDKSFKTIKWNDIYYESSNNFKYFSYFDQENKFLKAKNYLNMKQVKIFYITMTLFLFTILKELLFPLLYQITKK